MTTVTFNNLTEVRTNWALPWLKEAQKRFNKQPNANNWNDCTRAMLVYQQLEFADRCSSIDSGKLWAALQEPKLTMGEWPDVICRITCDRACNDTLRYAGALA
jgi:hypothetical protein